MHLRYVHEESEITLSFPFGCKFTTSAFASMQRPGGCGAGSCVLQSMLVGTTSEPARAHNRRKIVYISYYKKMPIF